METPENCKFFPPDEYKKIIRKYHVIEKLSEKYGIRFTICGYYKRSVFYDGQEYVYTIMRIRDADHHNRTHAILFDFMVPYHQISSSDLLLIIGSSEEDLLAMGSIEEDVIYRYKDAVKKLGIRSYLEACVHWGRGHILTEKAEIEIIPISS